MDNTTIIGSIAAFFTTIAYIPQAIKVYKTKHTKDLSIWMLAILTSGIFLWTFYGILLKDNILIFANSISCIISGYILYMKVKHG
ncbi:MAG: SemiSWEET transporter [Deltaproteobacteria bacterium]|nr:SemiSWEET transporter [Deltaproteobacteria bacterium]